MTPIELTDGTTITLSIGMLSTLFGVATAWISLREKVAQLSEKVAELKATTRENAKDIRRIEGFTNRRRGRETQELFIAQPRPGRARTAPPTPYQDDED